MRTKSSTCARKARFGSADEAIAAIHDSGLDLRFYRCDRGDHFHLTSRTKGKHWPARNAPLKAGL
jgi:hypothetical protein